MTIRAALFAARVVLFCLGFAAIIVLAALVGSCQPAHADACCCGGDVGCWTPVPGATPACPTPCSYSGTDVCFATGPTWTATATSTRTATATNTATATSTATNTNTPVNTATSTATATNTTGTSALPDWSTSMAALYLFENNWNDSSGHSSANLTATGSPTFDSTNKMQGSYAASFAAASNQYASCTSSTCTTTKTAGSVSAGCWVRPVSGSQAMRAIDNSQGATTFWYFARNQDFGSPAMLVSAAGGAIGATDTVVTASAWRHLAFVFDDAADTITAYQSNKGTATNQSGQATGVTGGSTWNPSRFEISSEDTTKDWDGQIDECWVYAGAMSAASICRICSCGVDGSQCTRSGTSFVSTGRNASNCGSCTLPSDASQATP